MRAAIKTGPITLCETGHRPGGSRAPIRCRCHRMRAGMPRGGPSPACGAGGLAGYDAPISAADPVGDQPAVLLRCLLPCEVTGVERVNLAVREELAEILVVRPRHELVVLACHDLGRGGDRGQQVLEHLVLLGVVPYEPGRLRKPDRKS